MCVDASWIYSIHVYDGLSVNDAEYFTHAAGCASPREVFANLLYIKAVSCHISILYMTYPGELWPREAADSYVAFYRGAVSAFASFFEPAKGF
jgi:hypothetical protein